MSVNKKYDVIIVGSGIGGLVCGCYLAKAGKKTLMLEQHSKPGGYCSSFERNGFTFDSSIHYIKFKEGGSLISSIIKDFNLNKYVKFKKLDLSDSIITPAGKFCITSDVNKTIANLIDLFPDEENNIKKFFEFLNTNNVGILYSKTRDQTFSELIKSYFSSKELISIFNLLLMNIGLPMNKASALKSYYFFKEFFFSQSYYPLGGMQRFSDALAQAYCNYGGEILYSSRVEKLKIINNKCQGVSVKNNFIASTYVVSNIDPKSTFLEFIGEDNISQGLRKKIKKMIPSISALDLYIGLAKNAKFNYPIDNSLWYFPSFDISKIYNNIEKNRSITHDRYLICSFPSSYDKSLAPDGGTSLVIFSGTLFNTKEYWKKNKEAYANSIVEKAKSICPNISDAIKVLCTATPYTFFRYTNNFKGACYGLASLKEQMYSSFMPQKTEIENLLMAGHWTTHGVGQGGISMVAFSGVSAAKRILKDSLKGKK